MKLTFRIEGSEPVPYQVIARRTGENLTMTCDCMAGSMGRHCKHRVNLLVGDLTNLVSNNPKDVEKLAEMVKGTDVERALARMLTAELEMEVAKKALAATKKALARTLSD